MNAWITAAARTPWAPRHTELSRVPPHILLARALDAVALAAPLDIRDVEHVLVACDTGVGAQALNIARRAMFELGWLNTPALTIDGHGVGDLGAIDLAARTQGVTVVGAVDVTSTVPPGANLVRDYGRPSLDEPEVVWVERLAREGGLDRAALDDAARRLGDSTIKTRTSLAGVQVGSTRVEADVGAGLGFLEDDLEPLAGPAGLVTARHHAPLADGAAAVVVKTDDNAVVGGRRIEQSAMSAGPVESLVERLRDALGERHPVLADSSVVVHELVAHRSRHGVPSVLALGSTPSADGLRMVVDLFHSIDEPCGVVRRGGHGQLAQVGLGSTPSRRTNLAG